MAINNETKIAVFGERKSSCFLTKKMKAMKHTTSPRNLNFGASMPVSTNAKAIYLFCEVSSVKRYHAMPVQMANCPNTGNSARELASVSGWYIIHDIKVRTMDASIHFFCFSVNRGFRIQVQKMIEKGRICCINSNHTAPGTFTFIINEYAT